MSAHELYSDVPRGQILATYDTYAEAQKAVDFLSDEGFPVQHVSIVGSDLRMVENVMVRLTRAGRPPLARPPAPGSACSSASCSHYLPPKASRALWAWGWPRVCSTAWSSERSSASPATHSRGGKARLHQSQQDREQAAMIFFCTWAEADRGARGAGSDDPRGRLIAGTCACRASPGPSAPRVVNDRVNGSCYRPNGHGLPQRGAFGTARPLRTDRFSPFGPRYQRRDRTAVPTGTVYTPRAENPCSTASPEADVSLAVAGAVLIVAVIGGGTATAADFVTSKDVKDDSLRSGDVRDGSLKVKDLAARAVSRLQGATGAKGATGASGARTARPARPAPRATRVRRARRATRARTRLMPVRTGRSSTATSSVTATPTSAPDRRVRRSVKGRSASVPVPPATRPPSETRSTSRVIWSAGSRRLASRFSRR